VAYHSSLHASLRRPHGRGRAAGLHEMLIGAGNASVPLAGGALARASGSLAAPFLLAGALLSAGLVTTLVRRRPSVAAMPDAS
jgi:predicted MFS family arabinose efflux permease